MNVKKSLVLLIAIVALAACNNSSTTDDKSADSIPANLNTQTVVPDTTVPGQPVQVSTSPANTQLTSPTTQSIQPVTNTGSGGLNPEHGKPGHRCDIAVGAPLNSTPATTTTPNNTPAVDIQKTLTPATTNGSASKTGLNPEHGKPGHRCDIAVGAPLDSKPAASSTITTPAVNTPVTPSIAQPVTPVLPTTTNTTPGTNSSGLNPEHGKPGHRCDIAVGAPLNSKPVEIKKENN